MAGTWRATWEIWWTDRWVIDEDDGNHDDDILMMEKWCNSRWHTWIDGKLPEKMIANNLICGKHHWWKQDRAWKAKWLVKWWQNHDTWRDREPCGRFILNILNYLNYLNVPPKNIHSEEKCVEQSISRSLQWRSALHLQSFSLASSACKNSSDHPASCKSSYSINIQCMMTDVCIYIYTCRERERETERDSDGFHHQILYFSLYF